MGRTDDEFLDHLFDRLTQELRDGHDVDLARELEGHEHLREQAEELLRLARQLLASRGPTATPQIPGYEILRELGRGSMAVVYLARQLSLAGRPVALKVLTPAWLGSERERRRFLAEARALARLSHPHVISIHDVHEADGLCAYSMEWIQGESLADRIRRHARRRPGSKHGSSGSDPATTSVPDLLRIGVQLAGALQSVHDEGLLHRDVKPSNVLLDQNDAAFLSDFGLVRDEQASMHTQTGAFLGTLAFAAPEQVRGETVDARADVYALGATLYQALTLKLPVEGQNEMQIAARIEAGAVLPLRKVDARLPRDLETVIAKAMEPEPGARYDTAAEFGEDLERLLHLKPVRARPASLASRSWKFARRNRRSLVGGAAGFLVAVLFALGAFGLWFHRAGIPARVAERVREAHLALLNTEPFTRESFRMRTESAIHQSYLGDAASNALERYDEAIQLDPSRRDLRIDRHAVELGRQRLLGESLSVAPEFAALCPITTAALTQPAVVMQPPTELQDASKQDLRAMGLVAYLCDSPDASLAAWSELERRGLEDPLTQGLYGTVLLVNEDPVRAFPRLLAAAEWFTEAGFLRVHAANAALQCGDAVIAERLLDSAVDTDIPPREQSLIQLYADLEWLHGTPDRENLEVAQENTYRWAEYRYATGRYRESMVAYIYLAQMDPRGRRAQRGLIRSSRRWWSQFSSEQQVRMLEEGLEGQATPIGSLFGLLVGIEAARQKIARNVVEVPTLFTVDGWEKQFDREVVHHEFNDPRWLDGIGARMKVHRVNLSVCSELPVELRQRLVQCWMDPARSEEAWQILVEHDAILPEGITPFDARPEPLDPAFRLAHSLEEVAFQPGTYFNAPMAVTGDVDQDGWPDVLLATETTSHQIYQEHVQMISGRTGKTLYQITGKGEAHLGTGLAGIGDVNRDGVCDWLAGAAHLTGRPGFAEIRSGTDGALLRRIDSNEINDGFGTFVCALGDVNHDGLVDFAITAPSTKRNGPNSGRVAVHSADGRMLHEMLGAAAFDKFGNNARNLGDVDGDGVADFTVGTEPTSSENAYARVISGADGRLLHEVGGTAMDLGWRARPCEAGDLDADGTPDFAIGCWPNQEIEQPIGHVYVFSGRTGEVIRDLTGRHVFAGFGEDVVSVGDLNGDGRDDLAVTSWGSRSNRQPRVEIVSPDGHILAELPSWYRLRPLGYQSRFLVVSLGTWSRYGRGSLGGVGRGALLDLVGELRSE